VQVNTRVRRLVNRNLLKTERQSEYLFTLISYPQFLLEISAMSVDLVSSSFVFASSVW
jgi:hypothetical protein